jgi:hypothetical protein
MEITVRKATSEDIAVMQSKSTWGCGVSKFDWSYDSEERCLIIEGEVTVTYGGDKSVSFGEGDYVIFPKGLSCVWDVTKAVKKHYVFV